MSDSKRRQLIVEALPGYEPEIGRGLWRLQDTRRRTKRCLEGIPQSVLDWTAPPASNSIGTLLYHVAAIEMDWLYTEVLEQQMPQKVLDFFPYPVRDDQGRLTVVQGLSLERYLQLLDSTRHIFLGAFQEMTGQEFHRVRSLPDYDVTPEWVLHHLSQHEAGHRGEIAALRARAERALSAATPGWRKVS